MYKIKCEIVTADFGNTFTISKVTFVATDTNPNNGKRFAVPGQYAFATRETAETLTKKLQQKLGESLK